MKVAIGRGHPAYAIYQNPISNGTIQLQFTNQAAGLYQVQIANTLGQIMLTKQLNQTAGSRAESIDTNNKLAQGQ